MKKIFLSIMFVATAFLLACNSKEKKETELTSGILLENLDTTVNPADDFYQFACGGWIKNNPLTGEYARYGSFDQLAEKNREQLKSLIEEIAENQNEKGSIAQKIGDLYLLGMDSVAIEKQGETPIQEMLQSIQNMKSISELTEQLATLHLHSIAPFFTIFGESNPANSDMTIAWLWQSGLGIGDRDYYLESKSESIRKEYVQLIAKLFTLSGFSKMSNMENKEMVVAEKILMLETEMAKLFMDKNDLRDPYKTFNMTAPHDLQKMVPAINITQYLTLLSLQPKDSINISQPNYIKGLNKLLTTTDFEIIKNYLAWNVIQQAAPYLSNDFVDADFNFYGKILSGKEENYSTPPSLDNFFSFLRQFYFY